MTQIPFNSKKYTGKSLAELLPKTHRILLRRALTSDKISSWLSVFFGRQPLRDLATLIFDFFYICKRYRTHPRGRLSLDVNFHFLSYKTDAQTDRRPAARNGVYCTRSHVDSYIAHGLRFGFGMSRQLISMGEITCSTRDSWSSVICAGTCRT